jgi:hypothetical protein
MIGKSVEELSRGKPAPAGGEHAQTHGTHLLNMLRFGTQGERDTQVPRLPHVGIWEIEA